VEWRKPDLFVYRPDTTQPLVFVRKTGDTITPGLMFTGGGSIPHPFWVLRNYSPWGYGPASIEDAATIMSEVMKTTGARARCT
jgi:hypothetical protein